MVRRKLSELLDEVNNEKPTNYWQDRLIEFQGMLKEKKYSAIERRISDLLESDRVTGRVKPVKVKSNQG